MASTMAKHNKMKRLESKKSYSWWWDSHISPKNSKWLQENLEEMDHNVKRMLKLIEEDADSFAKKAEMYYQKRPELINLVEEFYRMYRSLAERYDNVTGELRKNIPSDLQSQGSGISDATSEPPSTMPSPDRRPPPRRSGPRAAGFDFFLGSGGSSSDLCNKEGDETSTLDSESESDDSSINNYSGVQSSDDDQGLRKKVIELEAELRDVKEKLRMKQEEISKSSIQVSEIGNADVLMKIAEYKEELRVAKQKIQSSEDEIHRLRAELLKYESSEFSNGKYGKLDDRNVESDLDFGNEEVVESAGMMEAEVLDPDHRVQTLEDELKNTKQKLHKSENELADLQQDLKNSRSSIQNLQDQLGAAQKDSSVWKNKYDKEKREVGKLQDRIVRYKNNLADRDQEIRSLKEAISNANKSLSEENSQLQAEVTRLLKERSYLEDNLKEMDLRCQSLEEDVRRVKSGKEEMEALLGAQIQQLKSDNTVWSSQVDMLNKSLDIFSVKYDGLVAEKDELHAEVATCRSEIDSKNDQIDQMNRHLHQLHMEHVELIAATEGQRKVIEELKSRVKELETEVQRQKEVIVEGAEEKREAIRQLCFSLEHYRNGYRMLRQAVIDKRLPVLAS